MCGFLISNQNFSTNGPNWDRAKNLLTCRGPDFQVDYHWEGGSVAHCRLEIIGLGRPGKQPFTNFPEEDLLVYNGEIYNYQDFLTFTLDKPTSDTQVLYSILRNRRFSDLNKLQGMFAFVYMDKVRNEIISGRDFFGIKPLYYQKTNLNKVIFSSVPGPILELSDDKKLDLKAISHFLALGIIPEGMSLMQNLVKHEKGVLKIWDLDSGQVKSERRIDFDLAKFPKVPVKKAIYTSIQAHLVSEVPIGVLLSGGIDSTLIASLVTKMIGQTNTFSLINSSNPRIDESSYSKWNARLLNSIHTEVEFEPKNSLGTVKSLIKSSGEPFSDAAYVPLAELTKVASNHLKVVLAGEGADELFQGYSRYKIEDFKANRPNSIPINFLKSRIFNYFDTSSNVSSPVTRTISSLRESIPSVSHSKLLYSEWDLMFKTLPESTQNAFNEFQRSWNVYSEHSNYYNDSNFKIERSFDTFEWLPNVLLEKSDRATMLSGIEARLPFLDPYVWHAIKDSTIKGTNKDLLRSFLYELLPAAKIPKKKMGLSVDITALLSSSGMDEYINWAISDKKSVLFAENEKLSKDFMERINLNNYFAFRVATLAIWQNESGLFL